MSDTYARALFSVEVETIMISKGYIEEAEFVSLVRGALIIAADEPGVPSEERCLMYLAFDR